MKTASVAVLALLFLACGKQSGNRDHLWKITWGFDQFKVGEVPHGFDILAGTWKVEADPQGKGKVLGQLAKSKSSTYNLILAADARARNVEVSARVRPVSGKEDRGGGVVWRAKDAKNYYVVRWNPLESNFRVYKVIDGVRVQIGSADATNQGGWHVVRAEMSGIRIRCYLDGKRLLTVDDESLRHAGRVGLWTKSDAVSLFTNFEAASK